MGPSINCGVQVALLARKLVLPGPRAWAAGAADSAAGELPGGRCLEGWHPGRGIVILELWVALWEALGCAALHAAPPACV